MDYTIIGDQVNLCSRVESLTRRYDVPVLITENSGNSLKGKEGAKTAKGLLIRGVERDIVKGRQEPVAVYSIENMPDSSSTSIVIDCPNNVAVVMTEK